MGAWPYSEERLRAMYAGGRGDQTAQRLSCLSAAVFGLGLAPRRWVTLEVRGRRSGRIVRLPLGMADSEGERYLVPMLGGRCNWVLNVRAAGGRAVLKHRRRVSCQLAEVPVGQRAVLIRRYLQQVPGARPHIAADPRAALVEFEAIAPLHPVFGVVPDDPRRGARPPGRAGKRSHHHDSVKDGAR